VSLAARGQRDMDTGAETIADPETVRHVRRQARIVHTKSFIAAAALTAIFVFV
jgi:hypothetical protein